jgi:hypothetical protein
LEQINEVFKRYIHSYVALEISAYGVCSIGERESVTFPNTWVPKAAMPQLIEHVMSLRVSAALAGREFGTD